ncbi:hypothetical protein EHS25_005403 [Saitozyma podzolica]|uniref:Cobalamin-independent methionine synthase MetE C-terminal/archaeal domain-containing protein n=1 Tax=Saitozyma podzolica TaxID=1890683 RepID=A0A427XY27_9TREE|nr:hypothetical protein EHS25_005403 [Saitozyma podzolica]
MASRNPPFRAEHLGSLLRPAELLKTRGAFEAGKASAADLKAEEDKAVREIVNTQVELGYRAVSDGEYRRGVFWGTFFQTLEGMTEVQNPPLDIFRKYVPDVAGFLEKGGPGQSCLCTGKIRHTGKSSLVDEWLYTNSLLPADRRGEAKLTMISPVWYHLRYSEGKAYPPDVYGSEEEYFADIAKAYSTELGILYDAGVRNVQIDDPLFACHVLEFVIVVIGHGGCFRRRPRRQPRTMTACNRPVAPADSADFCSEKMIEGWDQDPTNSRTLDELLDLYIKCYNDSIAAHKDKMHFGLHICRGNFRGSRHFSEGGYDRIAIKLFQQLHVSTYYLEYDTPRAGGFAPLQHVPKDKNVILGVITSKFPNMEDKEEMRKRVYEAAEVMAKGTGQSREQALERIGVSPQCGFASHEEGNAIKYPDMINKLKLVREIADEIWPGQP